MTKTADPIVDDEASDDPTPVGPLRVARIWTRRYPNEGSLNTSLKAMDVLYDAGEPLSREELETRLIAKLDPYERAYLQAWHVRNKAYHRQWTRRHRKSRQATTDVYERDDE